MTQEIKLYGIHQAVIEDRDTLERHALKIVGNADFNPTQSSTPLQGGAQSFPWAVENSYSDATLDLEVKQYDISTMKYFNPFLESSLVEDIDGDETGAADELKNSVGTSVFDATTGIASAAITTGVTPKFGNYILKAVSETTIDIFIDNELDGAVAVDENLKITSAPITIPGSGSTVSDSVSGLEFTGGSGTISMTVGDMARVKVKPINNYNFTYKGGQIGQNFKEFSLTIFGQKLNGNQYRYFHFPRVKASGVPINLTEKDWSTFTVSLTVMYDDKSECAYEVGVIGR